MDTQQNINQSGANISTPVSNPSQPPTISGNNSDNILFDFGDAIQLSESQDSIYHYFIASPVFAGFGDLNSPERIFFLDNLNKASSSLKNYLTSSDTTELIFSLGKEAGCDDGQISEIGVLIRDLLVGKVFIKDFPTTISSTLGIDDTKAGELANKIISQSFGPIIEDIKRIQRSKFPEKIMQLQKEGRPMGLTQTKPPVQASSMPGPQQPPQTPRSDIRPPATGAKPLDSIQSRPVSVPQKPQFKIPDLGQKVTKENSGSNAQKSLEEELEKVASVIDLRSNPKE